MFCYYLVELHCYTPFHSQSDAMNGFQNSPDRLLQIQQSEIALIIVIGDESLSPLS